MQIRFRGVSLTGEAGATTNTRAAATLAALDIPLDKHRTLTTIKGDGVQGTQITWHFQETCPAGNSSAAMLKAWDDPAWARDNPNCPLVNCKRAFMRSHELVAYTRGDLHLQLPAPCPQPFCETPDTRKAAAMERLGHPLRGVRKVGSEYRFQFPQSAAADFALWDDPKTHMRLPDAMISYLWCAFDNHRVMVDAIKQHGVQFAAVEHRGRRAFVGKDMDQRSIDGLEKILYRR